MNGMIVRTRLRLTRILLLLALLFGAFGSSVVHAQSLCASRLPSLPDPVSNNAVTSVDNGDGTFTLLSFMGLNAPGFREITPATYRMDWPGGSWARVADAPLLGNRPKIAANAITVGNQVYLQGGYSVRQIEERTEDRFYRYDLDNDEFLELAPPPVPVDDTVSGVLDDRYIYLVSGWNGPRNNNVLTVQFYDTQTDTWELATDLPGPNRGLFGHSGTIVGDRIVVFDGTKTGPDGFTISDAVMVGQIDPEGTGDLTNIAWETLAAHPGDPTYRAAVSSGAALDGQLLLLGGTDNPFNFDGIGYNGQPSNPLDQAILFDPVSQEWASIDVDGNVLPTMDHRGLVTVDGGFATIGGMTGPGVVTDEVVFYSFDHANCVPEPSAAVLSVMVVVSLLVFCRSR